MVWTQVIKILNFPLGGVIAHCSCLDFGVARKGATLQLKVVVTLGGDMHGLQGGERGKILEEGQQGLGQG